MTKKQKKVLWRIVAAFALVVALTLLGVEGWLSFVLYMIPYLLVGYDILLKAGQGIVHGQVFDENFLMAVATVGAMALGDYREGCAVMLFYQIGELFQSYAVGKSRRNIAALMDIRPDYANYEEADGLRRVAPEEVPVGGIIVVQPGERVPLDGSVVEGSSTLNTGALTGESLPRDVAVGDEVISGCVNMSGVLRVKTSRVYGESTVARILDLVENSGMKKAKTENFITRFAQYYTPIVCIGALALSVLPPLFALLSQRPPVWGEWINRALTFLVISCPCALVISIPLSFFGGIGGASRRGVLIKGSNYMEVLARAKYMVFDKTGTLTQGVFAVTETHAETSGAEKLLEYAALAESYSKHPISASLKAAYGGIIDQERVSEVTELGGYGITAKVDGVPVAVGNGRLMEKLSLPYTESTRPGTVIHVAIDGAYAGYILMGDVVKPTAAKALRALKAVGVKKTVMLTGDARSVAEAVGAELGVDEVHSQLLPGDKVSQVEALLAERRGKECLAFVGDGINDAPVLRRADVGIAMGGLGSDAAIEAADIVLMDDDPAKIALAMKISRRTLGIVYQNIVFALVVKAVCLVLGAIGIAGMWLAIFADVGVMVLAVLNAMRALATKKL